MKTKRIGQFHWKKRGKIKESEEWKGEERSERTYVIFDVDDEREDLNNHGENWKRWYLNDLISFFFFISKSETFTITNNI